MSSIYPIDSIKNVAETIGIVNLREDVARAIALSLEYRLNDIIETAAKFMRHAKRNRLTVEDLNKAFRLKNLEPLFGYHTSTLTRPTQFKRTTLNWQDLYYIEDEEIDFDKVIHASLPKAPLDTTFTAHWLAIEGVQPAIPQNPAHIDTINTANGQGPNKQAKPPLLYKRNAHVNGTSNLGEMGGDPPTSRKVETTLSHELRLFYDKVTVAVLSTDQRVRSAALASLRIDPGLNKLLPYLIQFLAGGIVEDLKSGEPQGQTIENYLLGLDSLLSNESVLIEPYLHHILPSILSTIVTSLSMDPEKDLHLRRLGASILGKVISLFAGSSAPPSLRPRICRALLRALLEPKAEVGETRTETRRVERPRIGAVWGIEAMGCQTIRVTLLPNLEFLSSIWQSSSEQDQNDLGEAIVSAMGKIITEDRGSLEISALSRMDDEQLHDMLAKVMCSELCQRLVEAHGRTGLIAALDS